MMQKEIFKEYSNIFYPEGAEIICTKNSDELEGVRGFIKEVRFLEEKETENEGSFEIYVELLPTEEQESIINEEFEELEFGFGFDSVILDESQIDVITPVLVSTFHLGKASNSLSIWYCRNKHFYSFNIDGLYFSLYDNRLMEGESILASEYIAEEWSSFGDFEEFWDREVLKKLREVA